MVDCCGSFKGHGFSAPAPPIEFLNFMKFHRIFFATLFLLAAGLGAADVLAQDILYTSVTGKGTQPGDVPDDQCANPADPCRLSAILTRADLTDNDTIAILISAAGVMVEYSQDATINRELNFQLYTNDGNPTNWEAGTLVFRGDLTIDSDGELGSTGDKLTRIIASPQVTLTGRSSPEKNIPGTVTISDGRRVRITQAAGTDCLRFDDLTIGGRTQFDLLAAGCDNQSYSTIDIFGSLTVDAELNMGGGGIAIRGDAGTDGANADKKFLEVSSSRGIRNGGRLDLHLTNFTEPNFSAFSDSDIYKGRPCFQVRGQGQVEMQLYMDAAQYVCVTVPELGNGDVIEIKAGTVNFGADITVDGDFRNEGFARTQFSGVLDLEGDLTIDGRYRNDAGTGQNPLAYPAASSGTDHITSPAEYRTWTNATGAVGRGDYKDPPVVAIDSVRWTASRDTIATCLPARRPGVHLHMGSMIGGEVRMFNIPEQTAPTYRMPKPSDLSTESGHYVVACQSGLFLMGNGITTIRETLLAQELSTDISAETPAGAGADTLGGYIYLGAGGNGYHNLVLEGDVNISGSLTKVEMASAAGIGTSINGCTTGLPTTGSSGNKVIFGGSSFQDVVLSTDVGSPARSRPLALSALSLDKEGGGVELVRGSGGLTVGYLEPLRGTLYTDGPGSSLLSVTAVAGGGGRVVTRGSGSVYADGGAPTSVIYGGGDQTIGSELGSASAVTILSTGVVSIGKTTLGQLNLFAGTLKATGDITISGTIILGSTGAFDLSDGSLKHTGDTLMYTGNMPRMAGIAWMADEAAVDVVTETRTIVIDQACDMPAGGLQVALNPGYTSLGGMLNVIDGALDLNGGGLVVQDRITGEQTITVGEKGRICDSMGGVACSGSAALEENKERSDQLMMAMGRIQREDSEKSRAALDKAVDAFAATSEAKTHDEGKGIMVGYEKAMATDAMPVTNITITAKDKMLPMVTTLGGTVRLRSATADKKLQLVLNGLMVNGDDDATVMVESSLGRLQVKESAVIESGKLMLESAETVLEMDHTQRGGTVESSDHYTVMGAFNVSEGTFKQAAEDTLSVAGDFMSEDGSDYTGLTQFIGTGGQMVSVSDTLGSVSVNASGGVVLSSGITQNEKADLTLQRGQVMTGDDANWVITNLNVERDLATRAAVPTSVANTMTDEATVWLGGRQSFIVGGISRKVAYGNTGRGHVKGGYLFPLGSTLETRSRYRPVILNFVTDMSPITVTASMAESATAVTWPAEGITAPSTEGGNYTLDTYAPFMWKIEFSAIPPAGVTLRVASDGLIGVRNPAGLRLVQWDCDGENPQLAGVFDLSFEHPDPENVAANGRINGVPNTTMYGVDFAECNLIGLAARYADNPIGMEPPDATPMANMQLIHNVVGATVDIYVDDVRVEDNFAFQSATSLATRFAVGPHQIHLVASNDADNSNPIASFPVTFEEDGWYTVIANGDQTNFAVAVLIDRSRQVPRTNNVKFRIVHGAADLGEVDLRSLTETGRWANNISFNEATSYREKEATVHNVELLDGNTQVDVFEIDLGDYINETLVLALSGAGTSSAMGLTLIGVDTTGSVFYPQVVTSTSPEELPTAFALQGNYPNPFNPSTQIQFDLPTAADVTVQVIDLLGRVVLKLPAKRMEAGASRTIELAGSSLASGQYLYQLIAEMESGVQVGTGRMMLIK